MAKIYISHLYADSSLADQISRKLSAAGHSVTSRQQNIEPGDKWSGSFKRPTKSQICGFPMLILAVLTQSIQKMLLPSY
jgi:hypothetical protein